MSEHQGEKGDRGRTGNQGNRGIVGETGETGKTGRTGLTGARGTTGETGPNPYRRLLAMFLFTVMVFGVLAYRSEVNARDNQVTAARANAAAQRGEANTKALAEIQARTSDKVLCPLYVLFLSSVKNPEPDQVDTPQERERYAEYVVIIQDGYDALGCKPA